MSFIIWAQPTHRLHRSRGISLEYFIIDVCILAFSTTITQNHYQSLISTGSPESKEGFAHRYKLSGGVGVGRGMFSWEIHSM